MKILLLFDIYFHHKNLEALLSYSNITTIVHSGPYDLDNYDLECFDVVYSPIHAIDVSRYPNTRFIFGPHFSVFPENNVLKIKGPNTVYIQPSKWAVDVWKVHPLCEGLNICPMPFGVNTDFFREIKPISERTEVFVYYKTRNNDELEFIENKMRELRISYRLFSYDNRYNETEYYNCIQNAKYGIWVGRHESQGFALEEALSCNVPLLVWDVLSMNQECGPNYEDIPATVIPYWDSRCGEVFYKREHFDYTYKLFMKKWSDFRPREYVLENLSREKCETRFIDLIKSI